MQIANLQFCLALISRTFEEARLCSLLRGVKEEGGEVVEKQSRAAFRGWGDCCESFPFPAYLYPSLCSLAQVHILIYVFFQELDDPSLTPILFII
jgi:hypothetical protein